MRLGLERRNTERTFCVIIPSNVRPGGQFQVSAGGRVVRLNCPENSMPGDTMHFTVRDNVPVTLFTLSNEDNDNPGNRSRSLNGGGIEGGSNLPPSPPSLSSSSPSPSPSPIIMSTQEALISNVVNRLSGVYRDPYRVMRDAEDLLLSSHLGSQLHPRAEPLSMTPGSPSQSLGLMDSPDNIPILRRHQNFCARRISGVSSSLMLMLKGTLPMTYRGVAYHIPIEMYLPPYYPARPPIVFVRPTATMSIKANHKHVGGDGMVYMPYLHPSNWKSDTSDLTELAVLISSMFGDEPPCYVRLARAEEEENAEAKQRVEAEELVRLAEERRRRIELEAAEAARETERAQTSGRSESKMCVICMERPVRYLTIPCGHPCLCEECNNPHIKSRLQSKCPECRNIFSSTVIFYGRVVNDE